MIPRRFAPRVLALLPVGLFLFTLVLGWPLTAQQADKPTLPPPLVPDGFRGVQPVASSFAFRAPIIVTPIPTHAGLPTDSWGTLYEEGFDPNSDYRFWIDDIRPKITVVSGNPALELRGMHDYAPLAFGDVQNASLQARILLSAGSIVFAVHSSGAGNYRAEFSSSGVILFRGDDLLASTSLEQPLSNRWAKVGLSVTDGVIAVSVDEAQVIVTADSVPLDSGTAFLATGVESGRVFVDDVLLEGFIDPTPRSARDIPPECETSAAGGSPTVINDERIVLSTLPSVTDSTLWTVDPANTDPENVLEITSGKAYTDQSSPSWSSDREWVSFLWNCTGVYTIWIVRADGTEPPQMLPISTTNPLRSLRSPMLSPVDDRVVYFDTYTNGIYVFDFHFHPQTGEVIADNDVYVTTGTSPSWSPDGGALIVTKQELPTPPLIFNIWRVDLTTGLPLTRLTTEGQTNGDWSPDGSLIAHSISFPGYQTLVFPATGGSSTTISGIASESPSWSPDGMSIATWSSGQLVVNTLNAEFPGAPSGTPTVLLQVQSRVGLVGDFDWGWPLEQVVFNTNTPQPTETPTSIPTGVPTLTDAELATVFPLPIYSPLGTPEARLVGTPDFVDRAYEAMLPTARLHVTPLCSRDANPAYSEAGQSTHALIAGARAEIWFTSTLNNVGANENLGQFTVLRIRIQDLPQGVRDRLIASVHSTEIAELISAAATTSKNVGWLYIAYAHQSFISLDIIRSPRDVPPYPVVEPTVTIGGTGNSGIGGGSTNKHLDVSAYYVSGPVNDVNGITIDAEEPDIRSFGQADYSTYFRIYQSPGVNFGFGAIELIDPLTVWPLLGNGVTNVDTECP